MNDDGASAVVGVSSVYADPGGGWNSSQTLGPPNVFPSYGDNPLAWSGAYTNQDEWIHLRFEEAVYITQLHLFETYNPQHTSRISALSPAGNWVTIYTGETRPPIPDPTARSRVFTPSACVVPFKSRDIKIELTRAGETFVELDAIRLVGVQSISASYVTSPSASLYYRSKFLYSGNDSFSFTANTCSNYERFLSTNVQSASVKMNITKILHPPYINLNSIQSDLLGEARFRVDTASYDKYSDNRLLLEITALPVYGTLKDEEAGVTLTNDMLPYIVNSPSTTQFHFQSTSECNTSVSLFYSDSTFQVRAIQIANGQSLPRSLTNITSDSILISSIQSVPIQIYCINRVAVSNTSLNAVITFASITAFFVIFLVACMTYYRKHSVIVSSSWLFNFLSGIGCLGLCLSILPLSFSASPINCMTREWIVAMPLTLLMSSLFCKTFRVLRIFRQKKWKTVKITDTDVLTWVVLLSLPTFLTLLITSIIFPSVPYLHLLDATLHTAALSCSTRLSFSLVIYIWLGILIVFGTYLSFSVRNLPRRFSDGFNLDTSIMAILLCSAIGIPIDSVLNNDPQLQYYARVAIILGGTNIVIFALFVPKVRRVLPSYTRIRDRVLSMNKSASKMSSTHNKGTSNSSDADLYELVELLRSCIGEVRVAASEVRQSRSRQVGLLLGRSILQLVTTGRFEYDEWKQTQPTSKPLSNDSGVSTVSGGNKSPQLKNQSPLIQPAAHLPNNGVQLELASTPSSVRSISGPDALSKSSTHATVGPSSRALINQNRFFQYSYIPASNTDEQAPIVDTVEQQSTNVKGIESKIELYAPHPFTTSD